MPTQLQDWQAMSWTMILDLSQAEAGGARASSSEGKHWWAIIQSERVAAGAFLPFLAFALWRCGLGLFGFLGKSGVWRPTSPSWSSKVLRSCRTWSTFLGNFHIGCRQKAENQDTIDVAKHVLRPLDILNPIWYYQKISGQTVEGSHLLWDAA